MFNPTESGPRHRYPIAPLSRSVPITPSWSLHCDVSREVRAVLKTADGRTTRETYIRGFSLSLCLIMCLQSALSETNFGRSIFFCVSPLCLACDQNFSGKRFVAQPHVNALIFYEQYCVSKKKKYCFIKFNYLNLLIMLCLCVKQYSYNVMF